MTRKAQIRKQGNGSSKKLVGHPPTSAGRDQLSNRLVRRDAMRLIPLGKDEKPRSNDHYLSSDVKNRFASSASNSARFRMNST